jgi:hypothetical protein
MNPERRQRTRLPWLKFSAQVKIQRSLFNSEWIEVVPYDYSEFGMGIQTDEQFEIDAKVTLSLSLEMDIGSIYIEFLPGFVRYKEKHHSRFNYGIEFDATSRQLQDKFILEQLIHIKKILKKRLRLQNRQL